MRNCRATTLAFFWLVRASQESWATFWGWPHLKYGQTSPLHRFSFAIWSACSTVHSLYQRRFTWQGTALPYIIRLAKKWTNKLLKNKITSLILASSLAMTRSCTKRSSKRKSTQSARITTLRLLAQEDHLKSKSLLMSLTKKRASHSHAQDSTGPSRNTSSRQVAFCLLFSTASRWLLSCSRESTRTQSSTLWAAGRKKKVGSSSWHSLCSTYGTQSAEL